MQLEKSICILTILLIILFVPLWANSNTDQNNQLTKAIQLFDKEQFAEAEPIFKKLLSENPNDFMINYFYGACKTENGHYSKSVLNLLEKASKEVSPLNINYYLGVQHHAQNNWESALKFYNKYKLQASETDQVKVNLLNKIQLCFDQTNPFPVVQETPEEIVFNAVDTLTGKSDTTIIAMNGYFFQADSTPQFADLTSISNEEQEADNDKIENQIIDKPIKFIVNSEITYLFLSNFRTEDGKSFYKKGESKFEELDRAMKSINQLREKYASTWSRNAKDSIGQEILFIENQIFELKDSANELHFHAKDLENNYWQNASKHEIETFRKKIQENAEKQKEQIYATPIILTDSNDYYNIFLSTNEFDNLAEEKTDPDLIYKIQIGAYSRGLPNFVKKLYDRLTLIRKIENYTDENGVVVYTTGNLTKYEDAKKMQKQIRQEGVEDAYVVPYLKGKRITLEQAFKIEENK